MRKNPEIPAASIEAALLAGAESQTEILRVLGLSVSPANYAGLRRSASKHGVEIPRSRKNVPSIDLASTGELVDATSSYKDLGKSLGVDVESNPRYYARLRQAARDCGKEVVDGRRKSRSRSEASAKRVFSKSDKRASGKRLKELILELDLMPWECAICGMGPEWNGQPLVLQIDHISGDCTDNRLENLRILCPNCHSQTDTHAGKNVGKRKKKQQTAAS